MKVLFQHEDDENGVTAIDLAHALIRTGIGVDILNETICYLRTYVDNRQAESLRGATLYMRDGIVGEITQV